MSHPLDGTKVKFLRECYFCHNEWGGCTCKWVGNECGFEWEGTWITDPNVDESGRFYVDPVEYYGDAYIKWAGSR